MISATGHKEADFARQAIRYCRRASIPIAIATAQPCSTFFSAVQRSFLYGIGVRRNDMQYCAGRDATFDANGSLKRPMLQEILSRSGANPDRVLFFDDQTGNLLTGQQLGIKGQLCNSDTRGLTSPEFASGLQKIEGKPDLVIFDLDYTLTRPNRTIEGYEDSFVSEVGPYLLASVAAYVVVVFLHKLYVSGSTD